MSMNRETKRMMQRQGSVDAEGAPVRTPRQPVTQPVAKEKTSLKSYGKEVKAELRKVAWPTKNEVVNYSIIVLITVVVFTALVAGLDWAFGQSVLKLFER
jgi:preprotein translocase subunit SecE